MSVTRLFSGTPPPDDAILWRYMKISTFFMLLQGKAFFPSVATLKSGDPLEGDLVPEPEWLIGKLDGSTDLFPWLEQGAKPLESMFLRDGDNPHMRTKILADIYIRELAKRRAVWCWFHEQHESAGMWSVYGAAGIAVATRLGSLTAALQTDVEFQIANIRYVNRNPTSPSRYFDPEAAENQEVIHRPHLLKGQEYRHEQEIRITTACLPDERGRLVTGINANFIEQVVISPLLPYDEAEALKSVIQQQPVWGHSTPVITRSSILGRIADEEESKATISAQWLEAAQEAEPELPQTLAAL